MMPSRTADVTREPGGKVGGVRQKAKFLGKSTVNWPTMGLKPDPGIDDNSTVFHL